MSILHGSECSLKLENLFFEKISFERRTENISNFNYHPSFGKNIKQISDDNFIVGIELKITNDKNEFEAIASLKGMFIVECPQEQISEYINSNAIAILFPYIRSQMTLITSQPNMQPIVLPPININALLKEQD